MAGRDEFTPVAEQIPFDNDTNGFASDNVQEALEEVTTSASPGFSFGRSGKLPANTWLSCETVPSNKAGRYVYIANAVVTKIFVSNEKISTFDVKLYYHYGDEVGLTLLGTVSIVAARGDDFTVNYAVPTGSQLAIRIGTGDAKNAVTGLELQGTNT